MNSTFLSICLCISLVVILILGFQVKNQCHENRDIKRKDQEDLTKSARLLVQSSTQHHPLFALLHAFESKYILDDMITRYGGINAVEKTLKLRSGRIQHLKSKIDLQNEMMYSYIMEKIIQFYPNLDVTVNDMAKLQSVQLDTVLSDPV